MANLKVGVTRPNFVPKTSSRKSRPVLLLHGDSDSVTPTEQFGRDVVPGSRPTRSKRYRVVRHSQLPVRLARRPRPSLLNFTRVCSALVTPQLKDSGRPNESRDSYHQKQVGDRGSSGQEDPADDWADDRADPSNSQSPSKPGGTDAGGINCRCNDVNIDLCADHAETGEEHRNHHVDDTALAHRQGRGRDRSTDKTIPDDAMGRRAPAQPC